MSTTVGGKDIATTGASWASRGQDARAPGTAISRGFPYPPPGWASSAQKLGVAYASDALPARIAERTGGYPSFVQILCDAVLKELSGGDLTITEAHVLRAEKSAAVSGQLGDIFRLNAGPRAQLVAYGLLERDAFSVADAEETLGQALGERASVKDVEQALLELRLFGFVVEEEGRHGWAIPLLRDTLRAGDPARAAARVIEEERAKGVERKGAPGGGA